MVGGTGTGGPESYVLLTGNPGGIPYFNKLIGYLHRMQDEGLVREIVHIGDISEDLAQHVFEGDIYALDKIKRQAKKHPPSPAGVFVGKIHVSERKQTVEAFKELAHRYPDINYEFYRLPEPVVEEH